MWDTFRPLRLSTLWREVDRPEYAYSWNPDKAGAGRRGRDGDRALAVHPAELTAGHVQHLAVHVVRPRGAEEEHRAGGLLG